MRRSLLFLLVVSLCATAPVAVAARGARGPTVAQANRAVVKEVRSAHAMLAYGDHPKVSASCRRLTDTRFTCSWSGSADGGSSRVDWFGRARATKYRYGWEVVLSDESCYDPDADTGVTLCDL